MTGTAGAALSTEETALIQVQPFSSRFGLQSWIQFSWIQFSLVGLQSWIGLQSATCTHETSDYMTEL